MWVRPPVAVVGENHDIAIGQARLEIRQLCLQHFMIRRVLEIDAQQLLLAADHSKFDGGTELGILVQAALDAGVVHQACQALPRLVGTDHRQQRDARTQRRAVARDVRGAARTLFKALDLDHRHRRFRRYARDLAEPVAVQHHVSDHQDAGGRGIGHLIHSLPMAKYSSPALRGVAGS